MDSLHKNKSRSRYWYCAFTLGDGTRRFHSTRETDKAKAWKICLAWEEVAKQPGDQRRDIEIINKIRAARGAKSITLPSTGKYFKDWLKAQEPHLSSSTHKRYSSSVGKFLRFLGDGANNELQGLLSEEIEQFLSNKQAQGLSPKSVNLDLKALRSALGKAYKEAMLRPMQLLP